MQKILDKINDILVDCTQMQEVLKERYARSTELAAQQKDTADKLLAREQELKAREDKVKNIENVVMLAEENRITSDKIKTGLLELSVQRDAFVRTQNRVAKEQSEKGTILSNREGIVTAREAAVIEREAKLEDLVNQKVKEILGK